MATTVPFEHALALLKGWKEEQKTISVFAFAGDGMAFASGQCKVTRLSEDACQLSSIEGFISIPIKDATFQRGEPKILDLQISESIKPKVVNIAKDSLRICRGLWTVFLTEEEAILISRGPASIV